jgi:hypothetical protein
VAGHAPASRARALEDAAALLRPVPLRPVRSPWPHLAGPSPLQCDGAVAGRGQYGDPCRECPFDWTNGIDHTVALVEGAEGVVLVHEARSDQRAEDVVRNNCHDARHHLWDVGTILAP